MRRILLAILVLLLPSATAILVYLIATKKVPTDPRAIGHVTTIAGAGYPGVEDGWARSASFSDPFGIAVDRRGTVFVADAGQSNSIRRITTDGRVEKVAGSGEGFLEGDGLQARFNTPSGIAIDHRGNILIADTSNNRIRKLAADGRVSTLAGRGVAGLKDGAAAESEFDAPIGIAVDAQGNAYVADTYNDCIRKISIDGGVTTVAGTGSPGFNDGNASSATFNTPSGLAIDQLGNIFVADSGNSAIRKITRAGEVSTIVSRDQRQETLGKSNALRNPIGIVVTHDGFLFVTDESGVIRISPEGVAQEYAGHRPGFADGPGRQSRFSSPSGIAIDRQGSLFVADTQNRLIRQISPVASESVPPAAQERPAFIQPSAEQIGSNDGPGIPDLSPSRIKIDSTFPWPLQPQDRPHEITGVVGEARGTPDGVALDHLHSGLDIRGNQGEPVLSVLDEKVSSPIAAWDFGGAGERIHVGLMSYVHIRVGRNERDEIQTSDRFKPVIDGSGRIVQVRARRGARFRVGDFIGTVNRLYHVHLNLGPWNAESNPMALSLAGFMDTTAPVIEPNGIEVTSLDGVPFTEKLNGRLVITGDVRIVVSAYDRVDGNDSRRKLGLYRAGYHLMHADGTPAKGFEQPLINIEFNRLPPDDSAVFRVYAEGSGVSAYGTPTRFKYIVTNRVRDGDALEGLLRTAELPPGDYIIRIIAEDYNGNRTSGPVTELAVTLKY